MIVVTMWARGGFVFRSAFCARGVVRVSQAVIGLMAFIVVFVSAPAPSKAATLNGTIFGATSITGLQVGYDVYELTFHNANSGSFEETFGIDRLVPSLTIADSFSLTRSVLQAAQDFLTPIGGIQLTGGTSLIVMPYASDFGDITYMTTDVSGFSRGVWGPFKVDATQDRFARSVAFATLQRSSQPALRSARISTSDPVSAFNAPVAIPGPPAGLALIGALGVVAQIRRRRAT